LKSFPFINLANHRLGTLRVEYNLIFPPATFPLNSLITRAEQDIEEKEHSLLSNHSDHQEKKNLLDQEFYNFAMT